MQLEDNTIKDRKERKVEKGIKNQINMKLAENNTTQRKESNAK